MVDASESARAIVIGAKVAVARLQMYVPKHLDVPRLKQFAGLRSTGLRIKHFQVCKISDGVFEQISIVLRQTVERGFQRS